MTNLRYWLAACFALLLMQQQADAQSLTRLCVPVTAVNGNTGCVVVDATHALPITGSFSATTAATATAAAPSYTEGQVAPISQDLSGNLRTLASVTLTLPTIGAAVPATGIYNGLNVAGTLRGMTGLALGSTFSQTTAIVDASGNQIVSFGNASISGTGAGVPASANYVGVNVAGNLVGLTPGVAGTAGSQVFTIQGITSMTPVQVSQATGANLHMVVDSGTVTTVSTVTNLSQMNGAALLMGNGTTGTGSQRVTIASDNTAFTVNLGTISTASTAAKQPALGTAGSASADVITVQGVTSMTPLVANPTNGYPNGAIPETFSATGTTAATTATLATAVGKTTYICGFSMRSVATAAAAGNATVTGTITGTLNFTHGTGVTPTVVPNDQRFNPCIPASSTNTTIAVVSPAAGTGGVMSVTAWGFQL